MAKATRSPLDVPRTIERLPKHPVPLVEATGNPGFSPRGPAGIRFVVKGKCCMTAPMAKSLRVPLPGAPSPDHPDRCCGKASDAGGGLMVREVGNARVWGTPRMVNLLGRSSNPSRFSTISPKFRINSGSSNRSPPFSSKFRAGMNSATKSGSSGGNVAIKFGSMVRLFSRGWQVPQVRPFPLNVSLKKRSSPLAIRNLRVPWRLFFSLA